ncbi:MAG: hypothetical protein Q7R46_00940 [bacterium]|nr:hypothetical protein [bacterium]
MKVAEKKVVVKFRKKDLISLVWPDNTCTSDLIAGVPKGVIVDKVAGTWTYQEQTYEVGGNGNHSFVWTGYPIGVYDRTNIKHLNQMHGDTIWVENRHKPTGW